MRYKFYLKNLKGRDHLEGNIKIDLKEMGCEGVDWIHLTRHRNQALLNTVIDL
jgi:hypothetical protein